jgi:hypothetical protein
VNAVPTPTITYNETSGASNNDGITPVATLFRSSATTTIAYSLELNTNLSGTFVSAWYDVNLDGTFQSNEILVNNQQVSGNSGSLNFNIPASALVGNGILRIMSYGTSNATPNPCPGSIAGEVEDYFVSIAPIPNPTNDNILSPFALPNLPVNYTAVNTAGTNATANTGNGGSGAASNLNVNTFTNGGNGGSGYALVTYWS